MQLKLKIREDDTQLKFETQTSIKEIMVNVDVFHPDAETIALAFKRDNTSGILELSAREFDDIFKAVKSKLHLIKGSKILTD
jgi:hypothetical protein